jgi:chromosome segregation ATPase
VTADGIEERKIELGGPMKILTVERILLAGVVAAASLAWTGRAGAQAQTSTDVLPALLTEVRGLRAAMEQMASAGPRIQLFTSRLQLQEARIGTMIRRLDTVRDSLDAAQKAFARTQVQHKQIETALAEHRSSGSAESRYEAKQAEFMLEEIKRSLMTGKQTVDRLSAEETQLASDIATEQARWTEINGRLDELEKLLSRR